MFCILEKDLKTYRYFRRYIECFATGQSSLELDNRIQRDELHDHLVRNGISPDDTVAKLDWVSRNAQSFRDYLNTIKLVYFVCRVTGVDPHTIDEEGFAHLEEVVNRERACLSTIF